MSIYYMVYNYKNILNNCKNILYNYEKNIKRW